MDESEFKLLEAMRGHVWGYFQLHAQQRLTVFNFYIVLAGALTTGLVTSLPRAREQTALPVALGSLLMFFSFVFHRLDQRNRDLIKNSERGLRHVECEWARVRAQEVGKLDAAVFSRDESRVQSAQNRKLFDGVVNSHWSFTRCFKVAFASFFLLGAGSVAYASWRGLRQEEPQRPNVASQLTAPPEHHGYSGARGARASAPMRALGSERRS